MAWNDFARGVGNLAYELSGVGDIKRGASEIAKGNLAGGIGRLALGTVGFLPVVGTAGRAAITAGKTAANTIRVAPKASGFVTKALNTTPVLTKGVVPLPTKAGKFVSDAALSPYGSSRIISQTIQENPTPASATTTVQKRQPGQYPKGGGKGLKVNKSTTSTGGIGSGTQQGGSGAGSSASVGGSFDPGRFRQGEEASMQGLQTGTESAGLGGAAPESTPLPGTVQAAGLDYLAGISGAAAQSRARQYSILDALSREAMRGRGQAADIYGGRAPAIRGQLLTGVQRAATQDIAGETQRQIAEYGALERAYGKAVADAYAAEAKKIKDAVDARSALVAQMKGIG